MAKGIATYLAQSFLLCAIVFGQNQINSPRNMNEAVKKGDTKSILELLSKGIDINCRDGHGYTPLVIAAKYSQLETARLLCSRGADTNVRTKVSEIEGEWGSTPLLWAAKNCNMEMARLLIEEGADVGLAGGEGDTPLIMAAENNCRSLIELLISKGAKIDTIRSYDGANALLEAVSNGNIDIAAYLLRMGAKLNSRDRHGRSLLLLSSVRKHLLGVLFFIELGLPVDDLDGDNCSAVLLSIGNSLESYYILEYLLTKGANPRIRNRQGVSPLMQASYGGLLNEVRLLMDAGALLEESDVTGETALHYSCRRIPQARETGSLEMEIAEEVVRLLLESGAQPNKLDNEGKTPLMKAACGASSVAVTDLLDKGALPNIQDKNGWTALMYAADWNQTAVIRTLFEHGAELDIKNSTGKTALGVAKGKSASISAYELLKTLGAK